MANIDVAEMRRQLLKRYKTNSFRLKLEKMDNTQVYAMYTRLQKGGVFK